MKIIYQVGIIFAISWISVVIEAVLPIAFPASVISMLLMFVLLLSGCLKIEHIREKSDFLLSNMAFFFIPAGVSIINYFDVLKSSVVQVLLICLITTVITFIATAFSIKWTMKLMKGGK